jgi:hypothetical protein
MANWEASVSSSKGFEMSRSASAGVEQMVSLGHWKAFFCFCSSLEGFGALCKLISSVSNRMIVMDELLIDDHASQLPRFFFYLCYIC